MEASKPKWVNFILNIIGVNSLRLGASNFVLHEKLLYYSFYKHGFNHIKFKTK